MKNNTIVTNMTQNFTDAEKKQARSNAEASKVRILTGGSSQGPTYATADTLTLSNSSNTISADTGSGSNIYTGTVPIPGSGDAGKALIVSDNLGNYTWANQKSYTAGNNISISGTTISAPNVVKHDPLWFHLDAAGQAGQDNPYTGEVNLAGGDLTFKLEFYKRSSTTHSNLIDFYLKNNNPGDMWFDITYMTADDATFSGYFTYTGNTTNYVSFQSDVTGGAGVWFPEAENPAYSSMEINVWYSKNNIFKYCHFNCTRKHYVMVSSYYYA